MAAPLVSTVPDLPGVYFQMAPLAVITTPVVGVVAGVFAANDGPVGTPNAVSSGQTVYNVYGQTSGPEILAEAFRGGALGGEAIRVGSGASVAASHIVQDNAGTPFTVGTLAWKNPGTNGNGATFTLGVSLANSANKELDIYLNGVLLEAIPFLAGTGDEAGVMQTAVNSSSQYVTFTKTATGSGVLKTVTTPLALAGGTNPTVDGAAYLAALASAELVPWNILVVDSVDTTIQASVVGWAKTLESKGIYRFVALGDPVSVTPSAATRYGRAATYNYWNLFYVIDQYTRKNSDGTLVTVEGAQAAGRFAGLFAADDIDKTTSGQLLGDDVVSLPAPLDVNTLQLAKNSGAITFRYDDNRKPEVTAGVTAYVTLDSVHSKRWKNGLRAARRYRLMNRISNAWQHLDVENDANGWQTVIAAANGELQSMIAGHYFAPSPNAINLSTVIAPADDLAYFTINPIDQGKIERLVGVFSFS